MAAEGKEYSREALNAMLDKLAETPPPAVRRGPVAMCYRMRIPDPVQVDYKCPTCGAITHYMSGSLGHSLAFYRDAAQQLLGLGLAVKLDETSLCHVCAPGPKVPRTAKMAEEMEFGKIKLAVGDEVQLQYSRHGDLFTVAPSGIVMGSISAEDISNGVVVAEYAYACKGYKTVGQRPVVKSLRRGDRVKVLPGPPDDDCRIPIDVSQWCIIPNVPLDALTDLGYADGSWAFDDRAQELAWVINGKRTVVAHQDFNLLRTFLEGGLVYQLGRGQEEPLKDRLPRLRELLGAEPKK